LFVIQAAMGTMDGVIDTVSAMHPILPLISLLKTQGKLVLVGAPAKPLELPVFPLIVGMYKCMYLSMCSKFNAALIFSWVIKQINISITTMLLA
jgi:cinnamyl-alcohol dehydrogenase